MNVKPGQRAIIIKGRVNIGKIVTVLEDWADRRRYQGLLWKPPLHVGPVWLVRSEGQDLEYARTRKDGGTWKSFLPAGPVPDIVLMPLPDEEDILALDRVQELDHVE